MSDHLHSSPKVAPALSRLCGLQRLISVRHCLVKPVRSLWSIFTPCHSRPLEPKSLSCCLHTLGWSAQHFPYSFVVEAKSNKVSNHPLFLNRELLGFWRVTDSTQEDEICAVKRSHFSDRHKRAVQCDHHFLLGIQLRQGFSQITDRHIASPSLTARRAL